MELFGIPVVLTVGDIIIVTLFIATVVIEYIRLINERNR